MAGRGASAGPPEESKQEESWGIGRALVPVPGQPLTSRGALGKSHTFLSLSPSSCTGLLRTSIKRTGVKWLERKRV